MKREENSPNWEYYLSRPMSLFEASIWHLWYYSLYTNEILGKVMPDVLFVEQPKGICQHFRIKKQLEEYLDNLENIFLHDPERINSLVSEGIKLVEEARLSIANPSQVANLDQAIGKICKLGLQTAHLPRAVLNVAENNKSIGPGVIKSLQKIRALTIYPEYFRKVVLPLATKELEKNRVTDAREKVELITYNELINNDFSMLDHRLVESRKRKLYIYQIEGSRENVKYSDDNIKLIESLSRLVLSKTNLIQGSVAYPGKATGRVRVILDQSALPLETGDILVTINSTPELSSYIIKCAAIVTDEGGLGCHAATISREFKKPCIIGTKNATKVLKDGDLIEVDADEGIVRKI